jgi:hypothetical protein
LTQSAGRGRSPAEGATTEHPAAVAWHAARLGAVDLQLVGPGVAEDAEVVAAFLFRSSGSSGALQQDAHLRVGKMESALEVTAGLAELFFFGVEGGRPEGHAAVEVVDVDGELTQAAAVAHWSS